MNNQLKYLGTRGIIVCSLIIAAFSKGDDPFLFKASQANLAEIGAGKLAASKGSSAEVRKYGQQMVDDHSAAQIELLALAKKQSVTIPKEPDSIHKTINQQLAGLSGNAFDSKYIKSQLLDHQAAISLFQDESGRGTDPDVVAYAKKYLPKLKMHLKMFQSADSGSIRIDADSTR